MRVVLLIVLCINIFVFLAPTLGLLFKQRKRPKIPKVQSISDCIESLIKRPMYFINMRVKKDNNIDYFIDYGIVSDIDRKDLEWIDINYKKEDGTYSIIRFPSSVLFITVQEANAFLWGQFTLEDFKFMGI